MPLHCDGGPKSALNLKAMREEKATEARKLYAEYQEVIAGLLPRSRGRHSATTSPRATATTPIRHAPSTSPSRESRRSGPARRSSGTTM